MAARHFAPSTEGDAREESLETAVASTLHGRHFKAEDVPPLFVPTVPTSPFMVEVEANENADAAARSVIDQIMAELEEEQRRAREEAERAAAEKAAREAAERAAEEEAKRAAELAAREATVRAAEEEAERAVVEAADTALAQEPEAEPSGLVGKDAPTVPAVLEDEPLDEPEPVTQELSDTADFWSGGKEDVVAPAKEGPDELEATLVFERETVERITAEARVATDAHTAASVQRSADVRATSIDAALPALDEPEATGQTVALDATLVLDRAAEVIAAAAPEVVEEKLSSSGPRERLEVSTDYVQSLQDIPLPEPTSLARRERWRPFGFFARIGAFVARLLHLD